MRKPFGWFDLYAIVIATAWVVSRFFGEMNTSHEKFYFPVDFGVSFGFITCLYFVFTHRQGTDYDPAFLRTFSVGLWVGAIPAVVGSLFVLVTEGLQHPALWIVSLVIVPAASLGCGLLFIGCARLWFGMLATFQARRRVI